MRKLKLVTFILTVSIFSIAAVGCDKVSVTTGLPSNTAPASSDVALENSTGESSTSLADGELGSLEALDSVAGYSVTGITNSAYVPVSYKYVDNKIAQITYNHDGNTAVLRVSDDTSNPISESSGSGSVEQYEIADGITVDVQQSDTSYIAEWTGVDTSGKTRRFSLTEDNVDIALFENSLSEYASAALADDQEDTSEEASEKNSDETKETEYGKVVASLANNLEVLHYEVEKDGDYSFTDNVSSDDTYWDVYVLDEEFEDASRYIPQTTDSKGQTPVEKLSLKKGQHVYCICNKNQWTGDDQVDCNLEVTYLG